MTDHTGVAAPDQTDGRLLELLKTHFGYDSFRPGQHDIVAHVAGGGDALVLMPTGGGKSLCYQLPALARDGLTLVVSPLIALMKDQVDALVANGIAAAALNSSLEGAETAAIMRRAESGELKLLYVAPERLALPDFRGWLDSLTVSLIAVDEAHCISEWGHDFRPDYRTLKTLRHERPDVPVVALTASATGKVQDDIAVQLDLRDAPRFKTGFNRPNLTYRVRPKGDVVAQVQGLLVGAAGGGAIVYCFSRRDCERLADKLVAGGVQALAYHAGLEPEERRTRQERFMRDEVSVMTATIAFGMGIDKPDIRLVVHADMPKTLEGYYQETGRAGRDGLPSECVLLFSAGDRQKQEMFIRELEDDAERAAARAKLDEVASYCRLGSCRRNYLLSYFGDTDGPANCGGCDVCLEPRDEFDATELTKKIISAVARTGQRFGSAYITAVLRGTNDKRIRERGHETLSVFGIVQDFSEPVLKEVMEQLVMAGYLRKTGDDYPVLAIGPAGVKLIQEGGTVMLPKPHEPVTPGRSRGKRSAAPTGVSSADAPLFERLRALRRRLASEQGVPPYVVFGDAALIAMAHIRPCDLDAFATVPGVGDAKLERYGKTFTDEVKRYLEDYAV